MKPLKSLTSLENAMRIIDENSKPIERKEIVSISEAFGRVLAHDIVAEMNIPPFDRAAMDGYAVKAEDTFGAGQFKPKKLKISGKIHAGEISKKSVESGKCIQVATGSPMPEGADAVVIVENTELAGNAVKIFTPVYPGSNVSTEGIDIEIGETVLKNGESMNPAKIGVLAALGIERVRVYEKPKIGILSTGNEITEIGKKLKYGQIYDANSYSISGIVAENGGIPLNFGIFKDRKEEIRKGIKKAMKSDVIILSGGSSVGERDILFDVAESLGKVLFHGIAVKPGKPTLCGIVDGKLILGMPGYPTSCLINSYIFIAPLVRKMARLPKKDQNTVKARISRRVVSTPGRHHYLTIKIKNGEAIPVFKESGSITSMSRADGYIEIPPEVDLVEKGEIVEIRLF